MKTTLQVLALLFAGLAPTAFASSSQVFDESAIRLATVLSKCPDELAVVMAGGSFIQSAESISPRPANPSFAISTFIIKTARVGTDLLSAEPFGTLKIAEIYDSRDLPSRVSYRCEATTVAE